MQGYERLRERRRFLQPASGAEVLHQFDELSNPVGAFLEEKCDIGPDYEYPKKGLFEAWQAWCKEHGQDHTTDQSGFGRSLRAALPSLKTPRHREDGDLNYFYGGVRLKDEYNNPPRIDVPED